MSRKLVDGKMPVPAKDAKKGRAPSLFESDPTLPEKLRRAILLGAPVDTAAAFHGISRQTLMEWVAKAYKDPASQYGALIDTLKKACAEWEVRDLAAWDAHIAGRPAEYLMEPIRDKDGGLVFGDERDESGARKPLMQPVKDKNGDPVVRRKAIEPDWRAAAERLARRKPRSWAKTVNIDLDSTLTFDNTDRESKPDAALSFEQEVAKAVAQLEDDV